LAGPREDEKIKQINQLLQDHLKQYGFSAGLVFNKATKECMGRAGLVYLDFQGPPDTEIAIFLLKPFWKQGYGFEIVQGLVKYAKEVLKKDQIFATIDPNNTGIHKIVTRLKMQFVKEVYYSTLDKYVHLYKKAI